MRSTAPSPGKQRASGPPAKQPKTNYNSEYESAYDVNSLVADPAPGKARIEAFFTTKGRDLYAILPRWPGNRFTLKDVTGVKSVTLLGIGHPLKFKAAKSGISIDLPELPEALLAQPSWVLKVAK